MLRTFSSGLTFIIRPLAVVLLIAATSLSTVAIAVERGSVNIVGPDGKPRQQEQATPKLYGPIANADTLWRIASVTRPDGSISIYQMMYALYLKNPQAFEQGNIHLLSRGSTLVIPTFEEARQYTNGQAVAQLRKDEQLLAAVKANPAKPEATQPTTAVAAKQTQKTASQPVQAVESKPQQTVTESDPEPARSQASNEQTAAEQPAVEMSERDRRLYDAQMRQLKEDLANSIGSIESLIEQNQKLAGRVEDLSSTIVNLESELSKERAAAAQARAELIQQTEANTNKVDNLLDQPGASSIWLWLLSAGLAVVFGLIAWLMLRHRGSSETAAPAQPAPMPEKLLAAENGAAAAPTLPDEPEPEAEPEPEEDVLLDLGLDDSAVDDAAEENVVDLSIDEADDDPIEAIDLDDELGAAIDLDDESDLLARDGELSEPDDEPAEMAEIQELDLDLTDAGGELTQDALDALAAMDDLAESEAPEAASDDDSHEEAFDSIGLGSEPEPSAESDQAVDPDDIMDEFAAAVAEQTAAEAEPDDQAAIDDLVNEFDTELATDSDVEVEPEVSSELEPELESAEQEVELTEPEIEQSAPDTDQEEQAAELAEPVAEIPQQVQEGLDEPVEDELIDIDSLLAESGPAQPLVDEPVDDAIDIDSLITETQTAEPEVAELDVADSAMIEPELTEPESTGVEPAGLEAEVSAELEADLAADEASDAIEDLALETETGLEAEPTEELSLDALEQEFDLASVADELLDETPLAAEISEAEELSELAADEEVDFDAAIADIEAQAEPQTPPGTGDDDYLDIDQLLAEADGAGGPDDDIMLAGELDDGIELEEEDGVAAKLDLARAYIEIGDKEVAKQLLEEIVSSGDDTQKSEASELLERLD